MNGMDTTTTAIEQARARLIVALDVPSAKAATELVESLEDTCRWFKVGLELFVAEGPRVIEPLVSAGYNVFLDLKLHDIPNTVAAAARSAAQVGAKLLTVHASGGPAMLEAAENLGGRRFTNFRRITLPLAMPGIFAGSTIIFIWAFTDLGTPLMLDYRNVISRSIYDDLASITGGSSPVTMAKITLVLVVALLAYVSGKITLGRQGHAMTSKAAVAATTQKDVIFTQLERLGYEAGRDFDALA